MSFTDYLENRVLDHVFGGADFSRPATLYIGLCTGVSESGTVTGEPSGGSYARVAVTNNTTNFPPASGGTKVNGEVIAFPEATASWGTLDKVFIADSSTGGNVLAYGSLTVAKTVGVGDTPKFNAGALTITLD